MDNGLLIVGAGGHGKVVADAAMEIGCWSHLGFVDDRLARSTRVAGLEVVGRLEDMKSLRDKWSAAVIAIGNCRQRLGILNMLRDLEFQLPVVVHPSAVVSRFASLDVGTVVFAQVAINAGSSVGAGCIVNTGATIDHDCLLAEGVHICPGVNLAGNVTVGSCSWVGIGSAVRQGISIGRDVTVGAGSVVVTDVPDEVLVYGVPARVRTGSSAAK